jgi:hypothetical protein
VTEAFFSTIPSFKDFSEVGQARHYTAAPEDWQVVVTDVTNSTEAVESGNYRRVNIAGSAAIAAMKNLCKGIEIPFAFGGDGCTVLIPPSFAEKARGELGKVKALCQQSFGLSLRVGMVPVGTLRAQGTEVQVARYELSDGIGLAAFQGGGIRRAEELLKEGTIELPAAADGMPDTSGLSCRWEPLVPKKGMVLALLVLARDENSGIYQKIVEEIQRLVREGKPISGQNLRFKWPPQGVKVEARMKKGFYTLNLIGVYLFTALVYILTRRGRKTGGYDPAAYKQDVALNADYRKFDDMLRMVLDCSREEIGMIRAYLTGLKEQGLIYFGLHEATTALMTCLVSSLKSDGHVHFIDAADGGYAFAAKEMKAQMKA